MLGPVLFLIFINDITEHIDSQIRLFADDCLVYRIIHSPEDHITLQKGLTMLTNWAEKWQMEFNIHKCKMMQITTCLDISGFTYTMNNIPLEFVDQHNYLGVCLHRKLSWKLHVNQVLSQGKPSIRFPL